MDNFIARIGLKVDSSDGDIQNQINKKIKDARVKAAIELHMNNEQLRKEVDIIKNQLKTDLNIDINDKIALQSIKNVKKEYEGLKNQYQKSITLDLDKTGLTNNINSFLKNNTKLSNELSVSLIDVKNRVKDADSTQLKDLKKEFRNITSEAKALGQTGDSVFNKLVKNSQNFLNFLGSATIVMSGIRLFQNMIAEVKNLDRVYVDLQQATGMTRSEVGKLMTTYSELGQELGATSIDIANAAADWLRQGKTIAETNELIRDSMILSKIGQINSADATTYLTSAMKGYKVEVKDVIGIVDKLSAVDMASATSVAGLAEGMAQVANNANIAGISMDKLLGYLAIIGETTGASMSSVGNSLSTMFSRMGNIKLSRLKDYQNNGEDLSNVETVLRGLGIKLRDTNQSFRNFGEVLDETSSKWFSYDSVTQRAIASSVAGKDHMEDFLILMENYSKAIEYSEVSVDSYGTAMEKFSAYSESVDAKAERLSNSFQKLSNSTIDSTWVKAFLDLSNGLVIVTDKIGLFNIALLVATGILGTKTTLGMTAFQGVLEKLIIKMGASATAAQTLGMALSTILPTAAIIAGVTLSIKLYDKLNITLEEQKEITESLKAEFEDLQTQLTSVDSEMKEVSKRIDELSKKAHPTFVEEAELEKLKDVTLELESQTIALKEQAKYKQQDLNASIKQEFSKQYGADSHVEKWTNESNVAWYDRSKFVGTGEDYLQYQINRLKELNVLKDKNGILTEKETKEYEKLHKSITEAGVSYSDFLKSYTSDDEFRQRLSTMSNDIALLLDPAQFKTNIFETIYNSSDFEKQKSKLDELAKIGKLDESVLLTNAEYASLMTETGLSASELVAQIKALNTVVEDSSAAVTSNKLNWEENAESIDKFQSSISTIKDALTDLNTLSSDDILKLMTEFPQLSQYGFTGSEGVNALKNALMGMSKEMYNSIDVTVRENGLIKALIQNLNELAYSFSADKIVAELESIEVILNKVRNKQSLSADEIVSLTTKYKDLAKSVEITADGYSIEESALASLITKKSEDANTAIVGQINQTNTVIDQIKSRIKAYQAEAKALDELAKRYNSSVSGIAEWIEKYGEGSAYDTFGASAVIAYQNTAQDAGFILDRQLSKLDALKSSLQQVNTINKNSGTPSINKKKDNSTKIFTEKIDWIKTRFDAVERSVSKLNDAYSNADTDNQVAALEKLIAKQEKLTGIYKNGAKEYRNQYESNLATIKKLGFNAEEIFNKIKWGANSVEIFKDLKIDSDKTGIQEQLYNAIQSAVLNWNSYSSAVDNKVKVEYEIKDNKKELNELFRNIGLSGIEKSLSELKETNDELDTMATLLGDITVYDEFGKLTANGAAKLTLLNSQLSTAEESTKLYSKQIKILNEQYLEGLWTSDEYHEKLKELKSEYRGAVTDLNSYKQAIVSLVVDGINAETTAYKDQIDKIVEVLEKKKNLEDSNKSLLEKQKKLAILQKSINALSTDENNRENNAQRLKLEAEYAKLKEEIDDEVANNAHKTTVDSLKEQADAFEKAQDKKISELKNSLSQQEYAISNSLDIVSGKYESVYKNLVDLASSYGIQISNALTNPLESAMNSVATTGTSGNSKVNSSVYSVLTKNTSGEKQTAETGLNQYLISKGYNKLSWDEMVNLANALGLTDITKSDVVNSGAIRGKILNKLKESGFNDGGYPIFPKLVKATGEDGIALVKRGEPILNKEQGVLFKDLVANLKPLNNLTNYALNPYVLKSPNNLSNSISVDMPFTINGTGIDESQIKKMTADIKKDVTNIVGDYLTKNKR